MTKTQNNKLNLEQKIVALLPLILGFILIPLISSFIYFASSGNISLDQILSNFKGYSGIFSWYQLLPFFVFSQYLFAFVTDSSKKIAYIKAVIGILIITLFYLAGDIYTVGRNEGYAIAIWQFLRPILLIPILFLGLHVTKPLIKE